jgi:hypothetical protein
MYQSQLQGVKMSIEFLIVFFWFYIGFFATLYFWHKDFGEWNYAFALFLSIAGVAGAMAAFGCHLFCANSSLGLPTPSGISRKDAEDDPL